MPMSPAKLILSKKGFDTENGGGPSPILADGRMVPLPIPEPRSGVAAATYATLSHDGGTYAQLLARLDYRIAEGTAAHLDPDLIPTARTREDGWRGMFGQVDQAESHLVNEGVGPGSLFLFWGWYEREESGVPLRRSTGFSAIFGYLEVDEVLLVGKGEIPRFARHHPHFSEKYPRQRNRVYLARRRLSWNSDKPGWGVFKYSSQLRLSIDGNLRSRWWLPGCFHPDEGCVLTFNTNRDFWGPPGTMTKLQVPARGQEFVCTLAGKVAEWARGLIDNSDIWAPVNVEREMHADVPFSPRPPAQVAPKHGSIQDERKRSSQKQIPQPLPGERQVSYGDRLLWHQLGLQLNGHRVLMLTEEEFVGAICRHFPDAVVQNVRLYRSYFNGRHRSMGFRDASPMPIPVEFA